MRLDGGRGRYPRALHRVKEPPRPTVTELWEVNSGFSTEDPSQILRWMMRRFILWGASCLSLSLTAAADPVPVVPHGVGELGGGASLSERVTAAVGGDALGDAPLRDALLRHFGRFAPRDDLLSAQRDAISSGWDAYFRAGPRASRRALSEAVTAMEASPDALSLREDNRAAYLRAVGMLARIELEARHGDEAGAWARRGLRVDPAWRPSTEEFPPPVHQLVARLRGAESTAGQGRVLVRLPREGCGVTVDGAAVPGAGRERSLAVAAGAHRVWASCDAPSRVREVTVRADETLTLRIDPELDGRLQLSERASLIYPSAQEQSSLLAADAAALGAALGASQVVTVDARRAQLIDVARAQSRGELDPTRADLADALRALRDGRSPALAANSAAQTPHPEGPRPRAGAGAAPWVLVGTGAALAIVGGVFWGLREGAYSDLAQRCPFEGGAPACADDAALRLANDSQRSANLWQGLAIGAWAAGGVAVTSGLLWFALGARGGERVSVSASPRSASLSLRW